MFTLKIRVIIVISIITLNLKPVFAQQITKGYPVIGQPCPDFELTDVAYYPKTKVKLNDFKGKYLILDFWAKTCGTCINSFPHTDKIQKQFKDKLVILPVGAADKQGQIKPMFKRIREHQGLDLPCAFDSVIIFKFVPDRVVPNLVWIDKNGIVKAVTGPEDINSENIRNFISDKAFSSKDYSHDGQARGAKSYKESSLTKYNTDSTKLYSSSLSRWFPTMGEPFGIPFGKDRIDEDYIATNDPIVICYKYAIPELYTLATMGTLLSIDSGYYNRPIYEVKDSTKYYDKSTKHTKYYIYNLQVPEEVAGKETFMRIMQSDLKNYFGYNHGIERRSFPCLFLVIKDKTKVDKLVSENQGKTDGHWSHVLGGELVNSTLQNFVNILKFDLPSDILMFDKTGMKEKINIKITHTNTSHLPSLKKALRENGFDLEEGKIELKCLVIKD